MFARADAAPQARRVLAAAMAVLGIEALAYAVVLPHLPVVVGRQVPWWAAGALVAAYSVVQFLVIGPIGRLAERMTLWVVVAACLAGTAIGFLLTALSTDYWWLLAGRLIDGASAGTVAVVTAATLSWFPQERWTKVIGELGGIRGLGALMGVSTTAVVGIVLTEPERALSTMAMVGILLVVLALAVVPRLRPAPDADQFADQMRSPMTASSKDALRRHIVAQAALAGMVVLAPAAAVTVASTTEAFIAPAVAIVGLAVGQVALATRVEHSQGLRLLMVVVLAAGTGAIPFAPTVLAGFALAGVAVGSIVPWVQASLIRQRIGDGLSDLAANALAVRGSILGQITGPAVGFVALTWSTPLAALSIAGFALLAIAPRSTR